MILVHRNHQDRFYNSSLSRSSLISALHPKCIVMHILAPDPEDTLCIAHFNAPVAVSNPCSLIFSAIRMNSFQVIGWSVLRFIREGLRLQRGGTIRKRVWGKVFVESMLLQFYREEQKRRAETCPVVIAGMAAPKPSQSVSLGVHPVPKYYQPRQGKKASRVPSRLSWSQSR